MWRCGHAEEPFTFAPINAFPLADFSQGLADVTESVGRSLVSLSGRRWPSTGVAYAKDLLLTAAHAVQRLEHLKVRVGQAELPVELVGQDPALDVALLRVSGAALEPARWRPSSQRT